MEVIQSAVDIRRQYFQTHPPAFIHQPDDFFGVIHIRRHHGSHKFRRIVCFQPQCLIGNQRVGSGVRFVKPVAGEFLHQVKDFHGQLGIDAVFHRALFKYRALFCHLFRLFLTHCTTQHIRAAQGIARQHLGNLHHLFLIEDDAVRRFQYRLQGFMLPFHIRVRDGLTSVFTVDKVIHHARLQRAGPEQRHQGYHVFKAVRTQTFDQILHAAGFKLEDRCGFRALQHIKAFLVVERDSRDIHRRLTFFLIARVNHAQRPVDNRQCTQTEEVELHQTGIFHVVFIKLRDRVIPFRVAVKWCEIGNFCRRDHHTTGVFAGVTCHPFQDTRHIDQRPDFLIGLIHLAELRLCRKGFFQCHTGIRRHQFGNSVDKPVRMPQYTADIADNRFCRHRTEGNNLRNGITPVHFGYVINHAVTFFHAKVDVKVRHGDTFRVQEAFEQKVELQWIQIGDFQGVRHQ